jgi:hypothetical protein
MVGIEILASLRRCKRCGFLPSLLTERTYEFDYNDLHDNGCIDVRYQYTCKSCSRCTLRFPDVHAAFRHWNEVVSIE